MDALVEVLADCRGLAARLVEIHRDDGAVRCVVCSSGNQSARVVFRATSAASPRARSTCRR